MSQNRSVDIIDIVFLSIIRKEFEIDIKLEEVGEAVKCIHVYDSMEQMFQETKLNIDNPEIDEEYVILHRICRWVGDKLMYFSRLEWDERRLK